MRIIYILFSYVACLVLRFTNTNGREGGVFERSEVRVDTQLVPTTILLRVGRDMEYYIEYYNGNNGTARDSHQSILLLWFPSCQSIIRDATWFPVAIDDFFFLRNSLL